MSNPNDSIQETEAKEEFSFREENLRRKDLDNHNAMLITLGGDKEEGSQKLTSLDPYRDTKYMEI